MNRKTLNHSFLLFLTACIWGLAFVSQSKGMEYVGPFTFNGVRSLIGAFVLMPLILFRRKQSGHSLGLKGFKDINWRITLIGGLCCGIAITAASTLQQFGIMTTSVGKAGFITTLYIIFVPIFGIFLGRRVGMNVWIAAVMAAIGMYLLCMQESFQMTGGDIMVFLCALVFAVHIMIIDYFSPKVDGVMLSCIQFLVCAVICTTLAFIYEAPNFAQLIAGAVPILYAGIMSCGVAYTLQIIGQKGMNPTVAALILSLESVIATLAGYVAYKIGFLQTDQTLTGRQILGCVIVFTAVIFVQIPRRKKAEAN